MRKGVLMKTYLILFLSTIGIAFGGTELDPSLDDFTTKLLKQDYSKDYLSKVDQKIFNSEKKVQTILEKMKNGNFWCSYSKLLPHNDYLKNYRNKVKALKEKIIQIRTDGLQGKRDYWAKRKYLSEEENKLGLGDYLHNLDRKILALEKRLEGIEDLSGYTEDDKKKLRVRLENNLEILSQKVILTEKSGQIEIQDLGIQLKDKEEIVKLVLMCGSLNITRTQLEVKRLKEFQSGILKCASEDIQNRQEKIVLYLEKIQTTIQKGLEEISKLENELSEIEENDPKRKQKQDQIKSIQKRIKDRTYWVSNRIHPDLGEYLHTYDKRINSEEKNISQIQTNGIKGKRNYWCRTGAKVGDLNSLLSEYSDEEKLFSRNGDGHIGLSVFFGKYDPDFEGYDLQEVEEELNNLDPSDQDFEKKKFDIEFFHNKRRIDPMYDYANGAAQALNAKSTAEYRYSPFDLKDHLFNVKEPNAGTGEFDTVKESRLLEEKMQAHEGRMHPGHIYRYALEISSGNHSIALMIAHNTLKAITYQGREKLYKLTPQGNFIFDMNQKRQVREREIRAIVDKLINLRGRPLQNGDKLGPYYHLFAIGIIVDNYGIFGAQKGLEEERAHRIKQGKAIDEEEHQLDYFAADHWDRIGRNL